MLNVFLKLIAAATAAAIAEALLPDGGAKGGIASGAMKLISCPCRGNCGGCCRNCCIMEHGMNEKCRENTFWTAKNVRKGENNSAEI